MRNNGYLLKLFAALAILMLAVNAAVLHFGFGIHISDLADFIANFAGDGPAKLGDSPSALPVHGRDSAARPGNGLAEGWDGQAGFGDSPVEERISGMDGSEIYAAAMEVLKKMSIGDQIFLYRIFAKIGESELDDIFNMVQDGITADEIDQIKAYADRYLKPADAARLEDMIARYGHIYAEAGK